NNFKVVEEICPSVQNQFDFFQRTTYENLGIFSSDALVDRLEKEHCAMCIVNTRKIAQDLYKSLKDKVPEEILFHLSTTMHKVDREKTLEMIRSRLKNGQKVILIATSLVEAGVDLDFDTVFRQMAGLDSIIQAGGRSNREGKRNKEDSKTYIFELEGAKNGN
ncbi:helicase-related protein, partial [uncultured Dubosiella sp.]|uniref:helicase-related protein n=1 Tax=uncultured Dubosiella sp. TaxID=1937011 RepID=UPI0025B56611